MSTRLTLAVRNFVVQDPALQALDIMGKDTGADIVWPLWVWADRPQRLIENTQKCGIVFSVGRPWTAPNGHNTMKFPTLVMDIWADPTRNSDGSVKKRDAEAKIEIVADVINKLLHNVNDALPTDAPVWMGVRGITRIWGTASEIMNRTGYFVFSSKQASGPEFSDMANNDGGQMGRYTYQLEAA